MENLIPVNDVGPKTSKSGMYSCRQGNCHSTLTEIPEMCVSSSSENPTGDNPKFKGNREKSQGDQGNRFGSPINIRAALSPKKSQAPTRLSQRRSTGYINSIISSASLYKKQRSTEFRLVKAVKISIPGLNSYVENPKENGSLIKNYESKYKKALEKFNRRHKWLDSYELASHIHESICENKEWKIQKAEQIKHLNEKSCHTLNHKSKNTKFAEVTQDFSRNLLLRYTASPPLSSRIYNLSSSPTYKPSTSKLSSIDSKKTCQQKINPFISFKSLSPHKKQISFRAGSSLKRILTNAKPMLKYIRDKCTQQITSAINNSIIS